MTPPIRFYNTMTRTVEPFESLEPGHVKLYSCGPTVYNTPHIGNYRTFLFNDVLKRYLIYRGYRVTHVMNLTDVDDKTIKGSQEAGMSLQDFTEMHAKGFFEDLDTLRMMAASHYPRATETIAEMVTMIEKLKDGGYTYENDGSVYFAVDEDEGYGKLANREAREDIAGARVAVVEGKRNPKDFVLWKARKGDEPFWNSPFGPGRPGWHLECSAMARKYLGDTIDIHTGAVDLIFPHHTNEIAQSECSGAKPFVRFWMHGEFLTMAMEDGDSATKMSKSLGNVVGLRDLIGEGYDPLTIRYALTSQHYRKSMLFNREALSTAASALERFDCLVNRLHVWSDLDDVKTDFAGKVEKAREGFVTAMDNDLNISEALAAVFELVTDTNHAMDQQEFGGAEKHAVLEFLNEIDAVFPVLQPRELLDKDIQRLLDERVQARKDRDFAKADAIRDELHEKGIILEDGPQGTTWRRKRGC